MPKQEKDILADEAMANSPIEADSAESFDYDEGRYDAEMRIEIGLQELDKVITPLEEAIREYDKDTGRLLWRPGMPRPGTPETGQMGDVLMGVVRALRRKTGVGALVKVQTEASDREDIVKIENAGNNVLETLVGTIIIDGAEPVSQTLAGPEGNRTGSVIYPTLAKNLYMKLEVPGTEINTITLIAARPEAFRPPQPKTPPTA